MAKSVQSGLIHATQVAREVVLRKAPNGISFAAFGETALAASDLDRMVQAVPVAIAAALARKAYYFVPLAMSEGRPESALPENPTSEPTMVATAYTPELADQAICHRNVTLDGLEGTIDAVFISTRLLSDRFALAFEFFINIGHAFVDTVGVPASFTELVWNQALNDVRGETSQDAFESRNLALAPGKIDGKQRIDEKAKSSFIESAFSDALAIYQLSLAVDFDYSELREREYPLLAPQPLAERLRLVARLFPPNPDYDFAIRYRRRA